MPPRDRPCPASARQAMVLQASLQEACQDSHQLQVRPCRQVSHPQKLHFGAPYSQYFRNATDASGHATHAARWTRHAADATTRLPASSPKRLPTRLQPTEHAALPTQRHARPARLPRQQDAVPAARWIPTRWPQPSSRSAYDPTTGCSSRRPSRHEEGVLGRLSCTWWTNAAEALRAAPRAFC